MKTRCCARLLTLAILMSGCSMRSEAADAQRPAQGVPPLGVHTTDWSLRGGNAEAQYFSTLNEIDDQNVGQLKLMWSADLPSTDGSSGTPVVANGVVYVSSALNIVYAYDLRSGKMLWAFDPQVRFSGRLIPSWGARTTRGVSMWRDEILLSTGDCRLIAIDARTAQKRWEARVCKESDDFTITAAPRVGGDMVFVGPANTDAGTRRGYVDAFDAATGKHLWRFYTIPGDSNDESKDPAMRMAASTWDPEFLKNATGGSVWEDMLYDPVTQLLFIGVGGPTPFVPELRGPKRGDELFTNSIVALNAKTGAYVWHYQTTPGDAWNLEATMPMVLANMRINGVERRVLMQAPKNGFFYVLDPATGKLVNEPKNFAPVNWAKRIDFDSGRPVMDPAAEYWKSPAGAVVMPSELGAHSWMPMSYSPMTRLVYVPAMHLPTRVRMTAPTAKAGWDSVDMGLYSKLGQAYALLVAWDPAEQKPKWQKRFPLPITGGVTSTAGNLVFEGSGTGLFSAYRATDGVELWSFETHSPIVAAPVTVELDGKQVVIAATGNLTSGTARGASDIATKAGLNAPARLLVFGRDGHASLPVPKAPEPFARPSQPRPKDSALVHRGESLFNTSGCDGCHGLEVRVPPGPVPDLRRDSELNFALFESIVRGGARQSRGMPNFADVLSSEDTRAIQAYVLEQTWQAYVQQSH